MELFIAVGLSVFSIFAIILVALLVVEKNERKK